MSALKSNRKVQLVCMLQLVLLAHQTRYLEFYDIVPHLL